LIPGQPLGIGCRQELVLLRRIRDYLAVEDGNPALRILLDELGSGRGQQIGRSLKTD